MNPYEISYIEKNSLEEYHRHWWFEGRRRIIKDIVGKYGAELKGSRILDLGCGTGPNVEMLKSCGEVYAVDYSVRALGFCGKKTDSPLICADAAKLPFRDNSFSLICCMDLLEHVEQDEDVVKDIYRVIEKNGHLIITCPAFGFLWSSHDEVDGHKKRYSRRGLMTLLEHNHFSIERVTYINLFLFLPILVSRKLFSLSGIRKVDERRLTNPFLNKLWGGIFNLESKLLRYMNFPFGVSLLLSATKK